MQLASMTSKEIEELSIFFLMFPYFHTKETCASRQLMASLALPCPCLPCPILPFSSLPYPE